MGHTGIVATEGLNQRIGPGQEFPSRGILLSGDTVDLLDLQGVWWRLISERFGPGFAHSAFIEVLPEPVVDIPPPEITYTCERNDTLILIGLRFGVPFMEIAGLNGIVDPFTIEIGQVLRVPLTAGTSIEPERFIPPAGSISVLNPLDFNGGTEVTSSSLQGHHIVFLGTCSLDLDIQGAGTPGTPVRFNVAASSGTELRGRVQEIGLACRSQRLEDGGRTVRIAIESRQRGGEFVDTGNWVLYAHLDPVTVSRGEIVPVGGIVGALGPDGGGEYDSSCARASHIHIEASNATTSLFERMLVGSDPVLTIG